MAQKRVFMLINILTISALVLMPLATSAVSLLEDVGTKAGFETSDSGQDQLVSIIGTVITVLLSLLGVIFLLLLIYGGVLWMTSRGNDEAVTKAKQILTDSIIGLIIILAAYAISRFVIDALVKATISGTGT